MHLQPVWIIVYDRIRHQILLTKGGCSMSYVLFVLKLIVAGCLLLPQLTWAAGSTGETLDLTNHAVGFFAIAVFVIAYAMVMLEEVIHLKKSKPVILSATIIWFAIAWVYSNNGLPHAAEVAVRHNILEFAELMLFLLVAMTYINAMTERRVFDALRGYLVSHNFSFRQLFWITGILSFFISPIADNLTTALVMCAVLLAVAEGNKKFISIGCVNVVVAANAGGAFSPFGDITTLMVWQKGIVQFTEFFALFVPSVVNFIIPAAIMHFAVPNEKPVSTNERVVILRGGVGVMILFGLTILSAVSAHNFFHLPPTIGMMLGLAYLQFYSYFLRMSSTQKMGMDTMDGARISLGGIEFEQRNFSFDVFKKIASAEWDTLLFFFGIILSVGGLGFIGYLGLVSEVMYTDWGPTYANIMVGILSAIVDNIPVMFAVLTMNPEMSHEQWLLVTLTAGVGGSMLSIGSAAGVALMGQSRGMYTFGSHLRWTPVIALGYAASILTHIWLIGT